MNVLVTGGAGFIGSHVSLELVRRGHKVTVVDILSPQIHGENPLLSPLLLSIKDKVTFVQGDVRDQEAMLPYVTSADVIAHLASETGTGQSMYEIRRYVDTNITGTATLLDILVNMPAEHRPKKFVLSSSRAVYGEGKYECAEHGIVYPDPRIESDLLQGDFNTKCPICRRDVECLPTDEASACKPGSVYAASKQTQEQLINMTCAAVGMTPIILRYQNVYGPGQSLSNPYTGLLSVLSTLLRQNKNVNIFEDGLESRDFIYIDDIAEATVAAIETEAQPCTLNIGSGERQEVLEVARLLKKRFNSSSELEITGKFRLGDVRHNYADTAAAKAVLSFHPRVSFSEGLTRYAAWVEGQQIADNGYEKSLEEIRVRGLFK